LTLKLSILIFKFHGIHKISLVLKKTLMNIGEKFMNRKPNNEFEDIENSVKFEKLINKYYKEK